MRHASQTLSAAPLAIATGAGMRRKLGLLVVLMLWTLTWALTRSYNGITHDAGLYTLQALSHLDPQSLAHDVFLRFGSQDRYTIFSALYAAVIRWLGTEPAAAVLTFTMQLGLFSSAALFARGILSPALTLLGLSVFIVIPGTYGAYGIFTYIEPFVTPRMAAEALVLCGLLAAVSGRDRVGVVIIAVAMLVHPVMAAAGVAALLSLHVAIPRPRLAGLLVLITIIALVAGSYAIASGPFARFDPTWLDLVRLRSPYLFLTQWSLTDWARTVVPLATLVVGLSSLPSGRTRTVCEIVLITASGGLALTFIACDLLHLVIFTELQPWRWLWLAVVVAALLLPAITAASWAAGPPGKASVFLLAAAWILDPDLLGIGTAVAAVVSMPLGRGLALNHARLVSYGACGLLTIAILLKLASNLLFLESFYLDPQIPLWIRRTAGFVHDGTIPLALILLTLWAMSRGHRSPVLALLAILAGTGCATLLPQTWKRWSVQQFPDHMVAEFAPWRALIAPGTDVFWPESPVPTWLLLGRPSYLSVIQTSGVVFSRAAALEMWRRAEALRTVAPPDSNFQLSGSGFGLGPSKKSLERACETAAFQYLVTGARLSWAPLAQMPRDVWHASGGLRLYRCSDRAR